MVNSQTDYFADLDPFLSEVSDAAAAPDSAAQFFSHTYLGVEAEKAQALSSDVDGQGMAHRADTPTVESCVSSCDTSPMLDIFDDLGVEASQSEDRGSSLACPDACLAANVQHDALAQTERETVSISVADINENNVLQECPTVKTFIEPAVQGSDVADTKGSANIETSLTVQAASVAEAQEAFVATAATDSAETPRSTEGSLAALPPRASDVANALNNDDAANEALLRNEKAVQFVGFYIGTQLYAVPTLTIREVIRRTDISRLPVAVENVPGVISLRGEVLPLVHLRGLLQVDKNIEGRANGFNIICMCYGNRLGLQVDRVHSMYMIEQQNIQWNVSAILGLDDDDCVRGLFEMNEKLIPIISVERIATMLRKAGVYTEENK